MKLTDAQLKTFSNVCSNTFYYFYPNLKLVDRGDFLNECYLSLSRWEGEYDEKKSSIETFSIKIARQTLYNIITFYSARFREDPKGAVEYSDDCFFSENSVSKRNNGNLKVRLSFFWSEFSKFLYSLSFDGMTDIVKKDGHIYCLSGKVDIVEIIKYRSYGYTFSDIEEVMLGKGIKLTKQSYCIAYNNILNYIKYNEDVKERLYSELGIDM